MRYKSRLMHLLTYHKLKTIGNINNSLCIVQKDKFSDEISFFMTLKTYRITLTFTIIKCIASRFLFSEMN